MTEHQYPLSIIFAGWDRYQTLLVGAVAPLTLEHLALRNSPDTWSVGEISAHVIAARVWWFHTRMGEGPTNLAPLEFWDGTGQPARSAAELVVGLETTWLMIESALARWTPADLFQVFPIRSDDQVERSRQWVIWHTLEHDIHHGGEISSILGANGLAAVALE